MAELGRLGQQGLAAAARGDWTSAEDLFRKTLPILARSYGPRHPETATALTWIGDTLSARGQFGAAEPLFLRALEINRDTPGVSSLILAASYAQVAKNLGLQTRYAEAEPYFRNALATYTAPSGAGLRFVATLNRGLATALLVQGRYREAEHRFRTSLEGFLSVHGERHPDTASTYGDLGASLDAQERHAEAQPFFEKALEIQQAVRGAQHPDTAAAYDNLGSNLARQHRHADAQRLHRAALAVHLATRGERSPITATSYGNVAADLDALGRHVEAETWHRKSLAIFIAVRGERHASVAMGYANVAKCLDLQGRRVEAESLHRKALEIDRAATGEQHRNTGASYADLAANLAAQGRSGEAEPLAAKAVEIERAWRLRDQFGGGAAPAGEDSRIGSRRVYATYLKAASGAAGAAPAELARLQASAFTAAQDLGASTTGRALAEATARVAAGQAGLGETVRRRQDLSVQVRGYDARLLQALGSGDQATAATMRAELERSASELAGLDQEIRTRFPRYAELVSPQALEVAEVQRRLQPDEGVVLVVPGGGGDIHVFAVSKTRVAWKRIAGEPVAEVVGALREEVDPLSGARGAIGAYRQGGSDGGQSFDRAKAFGLYRDLIQPVEGALAGVKTLYVTASGPLSGLPLSLLLTEAPTGGNLAQAAWLADKYALVTLPSVSSLRALGALKVQPGRLALAGFGDPVLAGLAALPGTRTELTTMASALDAPSGSLRLGAAATETAVKTSADLSQARVVIFATHGLLPRELKGLEEPGLVFTPPAAATAEDDGVLTASEAARLNLSADWVILSACNTAAADGTPGAESLSGLAKAFLYAGAQALLASHWRVADDSTSVLTVQTLAIQKANPSLSKAQALQAAMKAVRTGKLPDGSPLPGWKPQWAHPAAWAPFTLVSAGG